MDVLGSIGRTPLVRLRKVVPPGCADVLVKLEWENPTGSLKDRMAQAVIERTEADGRLKPGDTVAALGAELTLVPSEGGLTTKKLILDMIETARRLSRAPHTYWSDQPSSPAPRQAPTSSPRFAWRNGWARGRRWSR